MKKLTHPLLALTLLWLSSIAVYADSSQSTQQNNLIIKESPYSVTQTMDNFENVVKKKGFTIFARIDHKKNAESADLTMNDAQVLIFGNPKGGTLLMQQDIRVALDLPLRVVAYQGGDDKVYIAYHDPMTLSNNYDLTGSKVIPKVTRGLDKLTSAAIAAAEKK